MAPSCPFPQKRRRHRGPRGPRSPFLWGETIRSRANFAFSVAGQLGRIRASGVKKVERVFRSCRPNVKEPNRFIRLQAGLCGLTELGLSGREKDLSPGTQASWVHGRPFCTKIRPYRPKKGLFFDSGSFSQLFFA